MVPTGGTAAFPAPMHVYILYGQAGVDDSPIPKSLKDGHLPARTPYGGGVISLEDGTECRLHRGPGDRRWDRSVGAGRRVDSGDRRDRRAARRRDSYSSSSDVISGGSCATHDRTTARSSTCADYNYGQAYNLGGGFTGSFAVNAQLEGSVTAELNFDVKRKKVLVKCVPYAVKFQNVHIFGNATANAGITLTEGSRTRTPSGRRKIAKTHLFTSPTGSAPPDTPSASTCRLRRARPGRRASPGRSPTTETRSPAAASTRSVRWMIARRRRLRKHLGHGSTQTITGSAYPAMSSRCPTWISASAPTCTTSASPMPRSGCGRTSWEICGVIPATIAVTRRQRQRRAVHALTFDLDRRIDITAEAKSSGRDHGSGR